MKVLRERVIALALQRIRGEKIGAARMRGISLIRHFEYRMSLNMRRDALRLLRLCGLQ